MTDPLEDAVYASLAADAALGDLLGRWLDTPALFARYAPPESDPGWSQYFPRVDFTAARVADPQRRSTGTLTFTVYAPRQDGGDVQLVAIDTRLRALLDGAALATAGDGFAGFRWTTTGELPGFEEDEFVAISVAFAFWEYSSQLTFDPDPIVALNDWTRDLFPGVLIAPAAWRPEDARPAVYWRYSGTESTWDEWASWGGQTRQMFTAHVLAGAETLRYLRTLGDEAVRARGLVLDNEDPLHFTRVTGDSRLDPLTQGQLTIATMLPVSDWEDTITPKLAEVRLEYQQRIWAVPAVYRLTGSGGAVSGGTAGVVFDPAT